VRLRFSPPPKNFLPSPPISKTVSPRRARVKHGRKLAPLFPDSPTHCARRPPLCPAPPGFGGDRMKSRLGTARSPNPPPKTCSSVDSWARVCFFSVPAEAVSPWIPAQKPPTWAKKKPGPFPPPPRAPAPPRTWGEPVPGSRSYPDDPPPPEPPPGWGNCAPARNGPTLTTPPPGPPIPPHINHSQRKTPLNRYFRPRAQGHSPVGAHLMEFCRVPDHPPFSNGTPLGMNPSRNPPFWILGLPGSCQNQEIRTR